MYCRMFSLFVGAFLLSTTTDVVQSKHLFWHNNYRFLKPHKVIATWEEAQQQCHSEDAVLASPIRTNLMREMKLIIEVNHHNTPYFIGTRVRQNHGSFVSEEGVLIDDMPVAEMLERVDSEEGDCLSMDGYSINVVPCSTRLPYICYPNTTGCSAGYKMYPSTRSCYKKHTDKKSWDQAEASCVNEGGHLVVINDAQEATVIKNMGLPDKYPHLFIGLRYDEEGQAWRSIYGHRLEEIYSEKATSMGNLACGVMLHSGQLDNYDCDIAREFICEKDPDDVGFSSWA